MDGKHSEMPDRATLEAEFFMRYPELQLQLDLANDNYQTALRFVKKHYMLRLKQNCRWQKMVHFSRLHPSLYCNECNLRRNEKKNKFTNSLNTQFN